MPRIVFIPLQFHIFEPKFCSRRFSAYGEDQYVGKKTEKLTMDRGPAWVYKAVRGPHVNHCPCWDDEVGPLMRKPIWNQLLATQFDKTWDKA